MIKFEKQNENEQFVSILVKDKTPTKQVLKYLSGLYPSINLAFYKMDNEEILLSLTNDIKYGFSLNELRQSVNKMADTCVTHFCVDLEEPTQRYAG